ncbi:hypothetical protein BWZ20_03155 [Winogradskyella sp. J14-2]|uniref:hypothetical protein n=1 Tax=Winogradskyella sp. J14-2 TaxID=1936080 RepID=UPI000972CA20|nr:hypothetical protein [Winogradskyella sp. J14-2]APY07358.1 hypothetical protein BWZ20_03155 [Winogradskyella sp. J14-2]
MKHILSLITVFTLLFTACEGDPGPPGPPGLPGQNGVNFVGQSFERTINFTSTNDYGVGLEIPLDIELLETDMVLVYRFLGQVDGFDVWRPLPETIYTSGGGEFQYNFEHNYDFVTIYLDAAPEFNFDLLLDEDRLDQTFRIVILPVDFINSNDINVNSFYDVAQYIQ